MTRSAQARIPGISAEEQIVLEELRRAALFRLLALMVTDPAKAGVAEVHEALARLPDPHQAPGYFGRDVWHRAVGAWLEAEPAALEAEYDRLFRRSSVCPPHETAYGDGRRIGGRPAELADIRGFYEAFGVVPTAADPDLPDHFAAELEFHAILLVKAAHARWEGGMEQLEVTKGATAAFLADHLGRWPRAFREGADAEGAASPYAETARLIEVAVAAECRRIDVRPRLAEGPAPPDPIAWEEPLICPMAGDCAKANRT